MYLYDEISQITTDKQLFKKNNIKKYIRLVIPKGDLVTRANTELNNFEFSSMRNNSFVYTIYKTKNYLFFVPFKECNSPCQYKILQKKDTYVLKYYNDKGLCTFYGIVDKEIFNRLLKVFDK